MKKTLLTILITTLVCTGVVIAATYTDTTPADDETIKIIEKEYLVPAATSTDVINMGNEIDTMNDSQSDITKILSRFNSARDDYNDGLGGISSKTSLLDEATCSFPEVPIKVE